MTFSEQFITIMDAVCDKFGIVINWTTENVMPYMIDLSGRIVKYEIASSTAKLIASLLVMILVYALYRKGKKNQWNEAWIPYVFGSVIATALTIPMVITQTSDIIKSLFLPEMIVMKFLSQFL